MTRRKYVKVDYCIYGEGAYSYEFRVFFYPRNMSNGSIEKWAVSEVKRRSESSLTIQKTFVFEEKLTNKEEKYVDAKPGSPPCKDCGDNLLYNENKHEWFCCMCGESHV